MPFDARPGFEPTLYSLTGALGVDAVFETPNDPVKPGVAGDLIARGALQNAVVSVLASEAGANPTIRLVEYSITQTLIGTTLVGTIAANTAFAATVALTHPYFKFTYTNGGTALAAGSIGYFVTGR